MSTYLLNANVLLAVLDPAHTQHESAFSWFDSVGRMSFATCPIVENGVVRIASSAAYPNRPGNAELVRSILAHPCAARGHTFWSDDLSIRAISTASEQLSSNRVTDFYLLALALGHGGRLVTFDQKIPAAALPGGRDAMLLLLPT